MKLTMMRGLPGSGKSTFARKEVVDTGNSGRVNRDDLRAMLFDSVWSGKREGVVVDCEKAIAKVLFDHGMNPIIDDTNLSQKHREMWSGFAKEHGQAFAPFNLMDVDAATCIERDVMREKSVGRAVIDRMALQNGMIDWGEKPIIICDVDGTLCDGDHRVHLVNGEAKDWPAYFSLLSDDAPISWVIHAINDAFATHTICLASGRPDTYQRETMAWMEKHGVPYHWLIMRAGSDRRPDTMVKSDFLKHFPKEKIVKVYDDQPSVIRMWRENGLEVIAVRGEDCPEF